MRNRRDKRVRNFNEIHVVFHPVPIRRSVRRVCLQTRIPVANPNRWLAPSHVSGLPVELLDGYMRLRTEPLLVPVKESKTTSDVVEYGISCVKPFGTLGAGDQSHAVYVTPERTGPRSLARAALPPQDQRFNPRP